jgi:hypothetical protein
MLAAIGESFLVLFFKKELLPFCIGCPDDIGLGAA